MVAGRAVDDGGAADWVDVYWLGSDIEGLGDACMCVSGCMGECQLYSAYTCTCT